MSKNSQYWQNRFKQLEDTEHASSVEEYAKIQEQFDIAQRRIQKEINSWYGRFAKENGVSMEAARKMLDEKQMAELKWDVNEYIKHGQQNALDPKWMHQLENASARVHISRLEAIKLLTQAECEKLYGNLTDDIATHLSHQYEDAYYHTAYEIARGTNIGVNFAAVNERKLEKIINKPWAADGKNFAVRLGENKANLINNIHKSLVQMTLTGENPDKAISMLSRTMNGDKVRAGRIIMTESAYFTELANKDSYNELGVQQYEIIATLDSHTSEICQEMDGKVFDMSIFEPGVTAPPFHPNCRSTTAPYFDENFDSVGERAARDENGKVYNVPANMSYKEWKNKYVKDAISDETKNQFDKYKDILGENTPTIEEFTKIKYDGEKWKLFKAYANSIKTGELSPLADFDLFRTISEEMSNKLIGITTSNGLFITGKSNHSIARVIGSVEQRRSGVQVSDILDALTNPESQVLPIKILKNGKSQKFRNSVLEVSINPDTGNIIQVNPIHRGKDIKK